MTRAGKQIEASVWCDAERGGLIHQVLGLMGDVRVRAIGGPRKAGLGALAESFDTRVEDDLRKMLVERPTQYLILASAEGIDPADLEAAQRSHMRVLAFEPVQADVSQGESLRAAEPTGKLIPVPWMRMTPAWRAAADPQELLGAVQSLRITSLCPPSVGSLYARLYDALDMVIHLMGVPATADAMLSGPLPQPPENLRGLAGHLTAHLRFDGEASAVLHLSDRSAIWSRGLTALGREGQLILDDAGYRLLDATGREHDRLEPPVESIEPADLIARQWQELAEGVAPPPPSDPRQVIACCQAALLSCRTGELESPQTLMRMRGA